MDLKSTQLKDTYGNLLTIGETEGSPTTGTLENGDGQDITALNVAGTITGVTLAGTLSTAAQTNITSVGTLTSLSSTGNINADDYSVGSWKTIDWTGSLVKFGGIDAANWTAISLHTSGSEKVRIDTSGNVGIGTTSPGTNLHIEDSSGATLRLTTPASGGTSVIQAAGYDSSNVSRFSSAIDFQSVAGSGTANGHIVFSTYPSNSKTERMRILSSGGITFNGDTATANALDDYEEGTWTPTYVASTVDFTSVTYDTGFTGGKYTKVGDLVHIQGTLRTDGITVGSASGGIQIGGLPFAIGGSTNGRDGFIAGSIGVATNFAGDYPVTLYGGAGTSQIIPMTRNSANGATSNLIVGDLDTGADKNLIYFSATYKS